MDQSDAVIIGGGPAGSTCARALTARGMDVILMDKQTFPRDKVCAGWITPAVVDELELDLQDYARANTLQPLNGFRVSMLGESDVLTRYPDTVSYGIRRCEFDYYLLQRCGARIVSGQSLKQIRRENGQWIINDTIQSPLLIGAGGHFCPVARHLGARPGTSEPAVTAQEIEFRMDEAQQQQCAVQAEIPELFFCRDLKGYGWVFRKGAYLNIGLGRQDTHKLGGHVDEFIAGLKAAGRIPANLPDRMHGHAYLLYGDAPRPLLDDGVLLIGDAAGLAYAQSGEGIRPAIESALMAASVILHAEGDYRQENIQDYEKQIVRRFGARDQRHALSPAGWLPPSLVRYLAGKLLANPWFSRHMVLDRWFFHLHQPPLSVGS